MAFVFVLTAMASAGAQPQDTLGTPGFPNPDRPVAGIISAEYSNEQTRDGHGEAERVLLAALLMEQASEADLHNQVTEWQKRYDIRRRKKQIRELSLAITQAQAKGDPVIAILESELRKLQDQARAVRGMVTER